MHLVRELGEYRGLVARSGADVEDALVAAQREQLADQRDHRRLRDRLSAADRKRGVLVRTAAQFLRHEQLARDAAIASSTRAS